MGQAERVQDVVEQGEKSSARRPRAAVNAWSINVLVIDDDPADSLLALDVLRRHKNVSAAVALDSPEEALMQLAKGRLRPDLILLDISMPKVSGFKFMEAIQEIPTARDTPIVMLTTSRYAHDVETARHSVASAYIVKPDSMEELRSRLDTAVNQAISGKWGIS